MNPTRFHVLFPGVVLLILATALYACTPKVAPAVVENTPTTPQPKVVDENLSPCPKFSDAPDPDGITDSYVIYRNFMKTKEYETAMKNWRKVYAVAPAADGKRNTVYLDGVVLYQDLVNKYPEKRAAYGDTIQLLYAQARECYPDDGFTAAMQGFDAYYTYPGSATHREIYELFKESVEKDGEDLQYFIINPMASLLVEMYDTSYIDAAEAKLMVDALSSRLEQGKADCATKGDCDVWNAVESYTPGRLEYFETVRGFFDCSYYEEKYMPDFEENPTDCDVIETTYTRLRWAQCNPNGNAYARVKKAFDDNCRVVVTTSVGPAREGYTALQNNDYREAINKFAQAAEETDDSDRKGKYLLTVAKIYYSHLKNFSQARSYARKAAAAKSGWGEPYLLIGRLYASSGPLCGPGRGFDSQIVVWPAIDMWTRARNVDPAAAAEATKFINRYAQYMPSKEDVFQRGLKEGDTFKVGCWIQETTRIRTPR